MNNLDQEKRNLYTIAEFVTVPEFSFLTQSALRHLVFQSRSRFAASGQKVAGNGLVEAGAILRIGKKLLIDATKFREWTLAQREQAK